ncbi:glutathione S-transferase family protein [Spirulina sp. CS-785/01]|uniref:glutathione S-transferase family protein n=1 Tax=Spirulina sp. CS-785/01 TaxID=3021716 RepID=UPI00232C0B8A|nr:glutathione S-transferase family protein [Spirulina sp. CS-785/01]MDB9314796.1 glutathione S-transferase family protein [Spirulina sp. CS-785/01]
MLQFYYTPISNNARRVWVSLLEKQLEFEPILMQLNGDQFQEDFLKLNPFHHIPVLVDDSFRVFESLAILDYLEAKYPSPSLLPMDARDIATVRMIELVIVNEFQPATIPLLRQWMEVPVEAKQLEKTHQQIATVLGFLNDLLREDSPYFMGEQLTLADVVAGTTIPVLPMLGQSLADYPKIEQWCDRLQQRDSWQQTTPTPEEIEAAKAKIKAMVQKS